MLPKMPEETPFRRQLQEHLDALDQLSLVELRQLASKYAVSYPAGMPRTTLISRTRKHIEGLKATANGRGSRRSRSAGAITSHNEPQGSAAAASSASSVLPECPASASPLKVHRLSYSAVAAQPVGSRLTPLGKVPKPRTPSASLTTSPVAVQEAQGEAGEVAAAPLRQLIASIPAQPDCSCSSSSSDAIRQLEQRVSHQEAQLSQQAAQISELQAKLGRLEQQQRASHGQTLQTTQCLTSLQDTVASLQDAAVHSQKLQQDFCNLQSKQEQLAEQQQREECQRSVVLRTPTPLPTRTPAEQAQQLLRQRLGVEVTVLRVQQLGQRSGSSSPRGSKATYKVVLASSAERDTVLRAKASALRGSPISIDVLLTKQQVAKKLALMPAAKRAAAAGRRVQWRYDQLYLDGKLYNGTASLPSPRRQQQQQQQGTSTPTSSSMVESEVEEGEWVQPKAHAKKQQRAAQRQQQPASKGAAKQPASKGAAKKQRQKLASGAAEKQRQKPAPKGAAKQQGSTGSSRGVSVDTGGASVDAPGVSIDTFGVSVDTLPASPAAAKQAAGLGKPQRVPVSSKPAGQQCSGSPAASSSDSGKGGSGAASPPPRAFPSCA